MDESRDSHGCGGTYCCCGNPHGANPECERCRLIVRIAGLDRKLRQIREAIEQIVCTDEIDRGVIMLSGESPTHYDAQAKCLVYEIEHFSELGDAMIALWKMTEDVAP